MRRQQLLQRASPPKLLIGFWPKVNEYDQEIPQSHIANQPTAPLQE